MRMSSREFDKLGGMGFVTTGKPDLRRAVDIGQKVYREAERARRAELQLQVALIVSLLAAIWAIAAP